VEVEIASRVAALFSSRREGAVPEGAVPAAAGAAECRLEELEVDTQLHYVHVCTLRKFVPVTLEPDTKEQEPVPARIHIHFTAEP